MTQQAMQEQEHPQRQTAEQKLDELLNRLEDAMNQSDYYLSDVERDQDLKLLRSTVNLLQRQARRTRNQRKTLRDLHRAHRAVIMENRWLRSEIRGLLPVTWLNMVRKARETLWSMFREESRHDKAIR